MMQDFRSKLSDQGRQLAVDLTVQVLLEVRLQVMSCVQK
jgi:hypothetical protein